MTPINTIIEEEKVEETFNYLCTVDVDEGGFMRANGTMDSYAQALWLRKTVTTAMQRAYEAGRADWLRSEIEKLEEITPTPPNVLIPGESPIEHALREGEYHALTSIITRYKEELKVLEGK